MKTAVKPPACPSMTGLAAVPSRQTTTCAPSSSIRPRSRSASSAELSMTRTLNILRQRYPIGDQVAVLQRLDDQPSAAAQRDALRDRKPPGAPLAVARRHDLTFSNLLRLVGGNRTEAVSKGNLSHAGLFFYIDRDLRQG